MYLYDYFITAIFNEGSSLYPQNSLVNISIYLYFRFGSISVICYVLFIVFKAIENLSTNFSACTSKLNWFGFDVLKISI